MDKKELLIHDGAKDPTDKQKPSKLTGAIVDQDGRPIPLEPVKAESLPPFAVPLSYTVSTYTPEQPAEPKSGAPRKKKVVRVAGSRVVDDSSHFTATVSLVTQLADNLRFPLQAGVSLRANGASREGIPLDDDPKHISRKQYFSKNAEITKRPMSNVSMNQTADGRKLSADTSEEQGDEDPEVSEAVLAMAARFADIDLLEGGRKAGEGEEKEKEQDTAEADFEVKYTSSNLNNTSSPKQPLTIGKPQQRSPKQVERPRDRAPPQAQLAPSERKRLPAPGIGKSSGHGLNDSLIKQAALSSSLKEGKLQTDKVSTKREDILRVLF
jgi:hypothetical protein